MKTVGIKLADGSFYPVMEEGSAQQKTLQLTTAHNNQTCVMVDMYRSSNCTMDDAEYIDTLKIENLVAHPNGEPSIAFDVGLDENGELTASINDPETGASSNSAITLVSRTVEERLQADNYTISKTENLMENIEKTGAEDTSKVKAAGAGMGLLAAAAVIRQKQEEEAQAQAKIEEPVADETDFTLGDPDFNDSDDMPINEAENPLAGMDMDFDLPETTGETEATDVFAEGSDETVAENDVFAESSDDISAETDVFADLPDDISTEPQNDIFADIPDDISAETDIFAESPDATVAGDDIFAESSDTAVAETDLFDMPDDFSAEPQNDIFADSSDNISAETDIFADSETPFQDFQNDDLFDMPDFPEETETSELESNLFDDDAPASMGSGISFTGLYDKETEMGDSAANTEDQNKKTKIPMIICIICAVICILATVLLLFLIPSKFNLLNKNKTEKTEVKIEAEAPSIPEPIPAIKEEPKPEPEPVPQAKEDEVIIIEKAEEVVPLPPPVIEEPKIKEVTYKIKWGDTLWDIANTYYKNPWRYKKIASYNGIRNPDHIVSGTIIKIPTE